MAEVAVYDEAIRRVASRMNLTIEQVDDVMTFYMEESKNIHIERGHFRVASERRTVVK